MFQEKEQLNKVEKLRESFPSARLHNDLHVENPHQLRIGSDTGINSRVIIRCGKNETGTVSIGDSAVIGTGVFIGVKEAPITIGDFTDIGLHCILVSYLRDTKKNPALKPNRHIHINEPIEIGRACMIAAGAIILGGTKLGDNCIVGAGAVVKGIYPANTTLIGNPARPVPRVDFD